MRRCQGVLARLAVARSGRPGPVVVALPENVLTAPTNAVAGPAVRIPTPAPSTATKGAISRG